MDKDEARQIAQEYLVELRQLSYQELCELKAETVERVGPSGAIYQVETLSFWDDDEGGDIRVIVSVDDGGWRAFHPLSEGFIMAPDGTFVGE